MITDRWAAQLTTHVSQPSGVVEDTHSRGAMFSFQSFHSGVAIYKLNGTILIADSGTTPGGTCTWSGSFVWGSP